MARPRGCRHTGQDDKLIIPLFLVGGWSFFDQHCAVINFIICVHKFLSLLLYHVYTDNVILMVC